MADRGRGAPGSRKGPGDTGQRSRKPCTAALLGRPAMRQAKSAVAPAWLQPATDYVPLGLFLLAYLLADILVATGVLVVATLAATALSLAVARQSEEHTSELQSRENL